jgi:hypothetical protein
MSHTRIDTQWLDHGTLGHLFLLFLPIAVNLLDRCDRGG